MVPLLVGTSVLFIINAAAAYYYGYYTYFVLLLLLACTSMIHHSLYHTYTNIIDKCMVYATFFFGWYVVYQKCCIQWDTKSMICIAIIATLFLCGGAYFYGYGYIQKQFIFDPSIEVSRGYHSLMHLFAFISHYLAIIL